MQENPSQKIIDKIKREKIVPESRIFLNWKSYLFWAIWVSTLFLGAVFVSFIILNLLDIHPIIFRKLGLGKVFFIFAKTAPYLWISLALLAVVSGFLAIRKTRRGYRYSIISITSIVVLSIAMLGGFLHLAKINRHLGDRIFIERGMGREMAFPIEKRWRSPEFGMLGGEVVLVKNDSFDLRGFNDEIWEVYYSNDTEFKTKEFGMMMMIEVLGEKIEERKFKAFIIQPFPLRMMPMR